MNEIKMKTKKLHSVNLALILVLGCSIFGIQPTYAALVYGDVSQEGTITAYDAALTAQSAVGSVELTPDQLTAADVSGDKQVTAFDAALIAQYAVGLINKFPVEDIAASKVLVPGSGWTGQTEQPATIGNPGDFGYDAKAIARWDVVPYQTFSGNFNVGVVAFHINDIDRVEFSVNGGDWKKIFSMTLNPQTNVVEYWATVHASDFQDGPIEIRAIAYPTVGASRVLGGVMPTWDSNIHNGEYSLFLFADAHGTLSAPVRYVSPAGNDANDGLTSNTPKQTTRSALLSMKDAHYNVDGGTIYLLPGTHQLTTPNAYPDTTLNNTNRWLTITTAPGVNRQDVRLLPDSNSLSGCGYLLYIRFKNLMMSGYAVVSPGLNTNLWWDNVVFDGVDRWADDWDKLMPFVFGEIAGKYVTDCTVKNLRMGPTQATLVRNTTIDTINGWALSSVGGLIANVTISDIKAKPGTEEHPDIYFTGSADNLIFYGMSTPNYDKQFAQGLAFSAGWANVRSSYKDIAIVNVNISTSGTGCVFCVGGTTANMYVKDSDFGGSQSMSWSDDMGPFTATNFVIENTAFRFPYDGSRRPTPAYYPYATYRPSPSCAPVDITSPLTAFAALNQPFKYSMSSTVGNPIHPSESGLYVISNDLPSGLGRNFWWDSMIGTPTQTGVFPIDLVALNSCGCSDSRVLTLTVTDTLAP